jgi:hypothetical protein
MTKVKSKKAKGKTPRAIGFESSTAAAIFVFCLFTFYFLLTPPLASAQDDDPLPPPPKLLTKQERTRLDGVPDLKARTKLAVDLIRSSIDTAEKLNATNNFDGLFAEFGHFRALVDYSLAFLQKQNPNENKSLDNYKRLEITLRTITPRIETIRRELPVRYEEYVRDLLNYVREARQKASDAMFSDTVLPTGKR